MSILKKILPKRCSVLKYVEETTIVEFTYPNLISIDFSEEKANFKCLGLFNNDSGLYLFIRDFFPSFSRNYIPSTLVYSIMCFL